jgi:acyl carrier protein
MFMNRNQEYPLTERLEAIVRRFAAKNKVDIPFTPQTRLIDDVGIDSLRMVDIVLEIEETFGFAIEDEDSHRVLTFADLVALVQSNLRSAEEGISAAPGGPYA